MTKNHKNEYHRSIFFRLSTRLFQIVIACPILLLWTRFVLGAKVYGRENIRGLKSGLRYATMSTCWTAL